MPRCRKCKKEWPEGTTACPDDGYSFNVEMDQTVAPPQKAAPMATAVLGAGVGEAAVAAAAIVDAELPPPDYESEHGSELQAGMIVGEYKVDKKIGEGGMGAVYSATHPMIGKRAAIKVISAALGADPSAVNRFVQEARSVNQIGHPNIVDVFAFGTLPDGRNYFVMEYLQGQSLADRLEQPLALGEAIEILDQVADALEAAHEKQIVHRDLKPDNVYLAAVRGGRTLVKLLDFGIAKLSTPESLSGGVAKTRTGMMMGTPGYISPEQARGKNVDHRTDIYALGCMIFEIVCGRLPFVADNAMDMVLAHMTAAPPKPSEVWADIPPPLEDVIVRMLDKAPENRPTLVDLRAVFAELVSSGLVTLDQKQKSAFRSGLRATPATGVPLPRPGTAVGGAIAQGTDLGAKPPQTQPPVAAPVAKKKTGLIVGAVGGVIAIGVIAVLALGGSKKAEPLPPPPVPPPPPVVVAQVQPPVAPPTPPAPPAPPEMTVAKGGTIELALKAEKGMKLEVDGKEIAATGDATTVPVDADGDHTIVVTSPMMRPFEQKVAVAGGAKVPVAVKLEYAPLAKKPPPSGTKPPPKAGSGSAAPTVKKPDDGVCDPFAPGAKC